jgi:predicted  nucleic acid-binding Zn-ribbon protein
MSEQQEETFSSTENNNLDPVNNSPTNNVQPVVAVDHTGDVISDINQRISSLEHNMRNDMGNLQDNMNQMNNTMLKMLTDNERSRAEINDSIKQLLFASNDNKLTTEKNLREVHERMDRIEEKATDERQLLHDMHSKVQNMSIQPALPDVDELNELVRDVVGQQLTDIRTSL